MGLLSKRIPNNFMSAQNELERLQGELLDREVYVNDLGQISNDGGSLNNGITTRGDGITIDQTTSPATFTGTGAVDCWPPIQVYSGIYAVHFLLNSGVVTLYEDASDGKLYRGAGAIVSDQNGETFYVYDVGGSYINFVRPQYNTPDAGSLSLSPNELTLAFTGGGNTESLANADFETGTLTNWTAAGAGTWSADTTTVYRGAKSAKCVLSGTSAHTLTSDRITDLGTFDFQLLVIYQYSTLVGWTAKTASVKWYDATSGGNLLQTDSVDLGNVGAGDWRYKILTSHGPGNALSCEVVLSATASSGTPSIYFDGLRLRDMGAGTGYLVIKDTIRGALNGTFSSVGAPSTADANQGPAVNPYWVADSGQVSNLHYGDYAGYALIVAASTTPTVGYARTIQQGAMGPNGFFVYDAWFLVSNTGATSVNCTFDVIFGGTTVYSHTTNNTGTSTPRYLLVHMFGIIANRNSESSQYCAHTRIDSPALTDSTTSVGAATTGGQIKTASINTSIADRDFVINGTLNTATNSKAERLGVNLYGPYYVT